MNKYKILIDPHGAVGWKTLETFLNGDLNKTSVIYETADPGKFPVDVKKATKVTPKLPERMQKQIHLKERIYKVNEKDFDSQLEKIKKIITLILN